MHPSLPLPDRPLRFLVLFCGTAALLLGLWTRLAGGYGRLLLETVNLVGAWTGLPAHWRLAATPDTTWMGVGVIGAMALFLVTPGRGALWKAGWILAVSGLLLTAHVAVVTLQLHSAWGSAPGAGDLPSHLPGFAPLAGRLGERLFPALMVLLWFAAGLRRAHVVTPGVGSPRGLD